MTRAEWTTKMGVHVNHPHRLKLALKHRSSAYQKKTGCRAGHCMGTPSKVWQSWIPSLDPPPLLGDLPLFQDGNYWPGQATGKIREGNGL